MKKLISLVLVLMLVFALAVPSFAYPQSDTEMEALNEIEYWIYWIHQDFSEKLEDLKTWNYQSMMQLLDINDFTRSIFSKLDSINNSFFGNLTYVEPLAVTITNSLSSLEDSFNFFNDSFFDNVLWGEPFAEVVQDNLTAMAADLEHTYQLQQYLISDRWDFIDGTWWKSMYDDLHQLKEVLASDEDLALRESVSSDVSVFSNLFFNRNSDSFAGLDVGAISSFGDFSSSIRNFYTVDAGSNTSDNFYVTSELFVYTINLPFEWFSDVTLSDLNSVSSGYSLNRSSDTPQLATSYYQDTIDRLSNLRSDFFG